MDIMSLSLSPIANPVPVIPPPLPSSWESVHSVRQSRHCSPPSEPQGSYPNEQYHSGSSTRAPKDISPLERRTSAGGSSHYYFRPLSGSCLEPSSFRNWPIHVESTTGQISSSTPNRIIHQRGDIPHLEHALPPSSYEPKMPPVVSSTQEGHSSRPSTGVPREVHNELTTKSGNVHPPSLRRV